MKLALFAFMSIFTLNQAMALESGFYTTQNHEVCNANIIQQNSSLTLEWSHENEIPGEADCYVAGEILEAKSTAPGFFSGNSQDKDGITERFVVKALNNKAFTLQWSTKGKTGSPILFKLKRKL